MRRHRHRRRCAATPSAIDGGDSAGAAMAEAVAAQRWQWTIKIKGLILHILIPTFLESRGKMDRSSTHEKKVSKADAYSERTFFFFIAETVVCTFYTGAQSFG